MTLTMIVPAQFIQTLLTEQSSTLSMLPWLLSYI